MKGLFIGLITIDIQFLVDRFPKENTKVKASGCHLFTGGPATNASVIFAALQGKATLVTSIGENHFSGFMRNELESLLVSVIDLTPHSKNLPTFASIMTNSANGDRTVLSYNPARVEADSSTLQKTIQQYDIIMIDGFHREVSFELIQTAKTLDIPVVLDGGSWKEGLEKLLPYIDIAVCSEHFFPPGTSTFTEVFDYLKKKDIKRAAITRGGESIIFYDRDTSGTIPVQNIRARDTLGAGDFFHGAFCYFYANKRNFEDALKKASEIAAKSCLEYGTRSWLEKID